MFVLVDNGEGRVVAYLVNKETPQDLVLRLFTNNVTPAETDTVATYTEASGSGYAAKTLTGADWTVTDDTGSFIQQTFTFTGALGNVYGYHMTRVTDGDLILAERFSDGPYNVQNTGDTVKVTPNITGS